MFQKMFLALWVKMYYHKCKCKFGQLVALDTPNLLWLMFGLSSISVPIFTTV